MLFEAKASEKTTLKCYWIEGMMRAPLRAC